ncbi:MAG TPA: hypothetical protein PK299_01545 [Anaerolineales bacterium]|nr:hypothetical protein [Anaerolineales bacterium]
MNTRKSLPLWLTTAFTATTLSVVVAILYAMVAVAFVALGIMGENFGTSRFGESLIGVGFLAICAGPFALVLGILPFVLVCSLAGVVLGGLLTALQRWHSVWLGLALGTLVGGVLAMGVNLALAPSFSTSPNDSTPYILWLLVPSILAVGVLAGAGAWSFRSTK